VFLNGVNLVRGQDYTATNGTSVGSLTALVVSDVVEVFAFVPFNIANALTVSTVDAKGDLLVGTGADAVGRLAVGTNGQLLAADSGETSGLKWANGGLTLIDTETFSAVSSVSVDNVFSATYDNYKIICAFTSADVNVNWRLRAGAPPADNTTSNYHSHRQASDTNATTYSAASNAAGSSFQFSSSAGANSVKGVDFTVYNPFATNNTLFNGMHSYSSASGAGLYSGGNVHGGFSATTSFTGFSIIPTSGNITGSVSVFGVNK
jgi:hypothetical protein